MTTNGVGEHVSDERLAEMLAAIPRYADGSVRSAGWIARVPAPDIFSILTELQSLRSNGKAGGQSVGEDDYNPDAPPDHSADNAADFIFKHLSNALGVDGKWSVSDGTETWDGDVVGTLYNILTAAGIWDDDNGCLAALTVPAEQGAQAEPVAWIDQQTYEDLLSDAPWTAGAIGEFSQRQKDQYTVPLYASPPPSQPLTAEGEIVTDEMVARFKAAFIAETGSTMWPTDQQFRAIILASLQQGEGV